MALILSRRPGEVICIGHDIRVEVLGVKGHYVRLGISAPKSVPVDREEVMLRKLQEGGYQPAA